MTKDDRSERFEDQLAKLEGIVARLEDDSVGLEEALDLFEEGMKLARACRVRLEAVEQRVEKLLEDAGEGEPATEPLDPDTAP
ncbi:MAG: exodeoxyribonuclease VII small subunit [Acidobacteria bacterium]|nr:exodeoxyribonuclease VII small subunit [Acidobacteriota bacterium]